MMEASWSSPSQQVTKYRCQVQARHFRQSDQTVEDGCKILGDKYCTTIVSNPCVRLIQLQYNNFCRRAHVNKHLSLSYFLYKSMKDKQTYSILFYSILFYSILFYSILFYSILFYSILFYSISAASARIRFLRRHDNNLGGRVKSSFVQLRVVKLPCPGKISLPIYGPTVQDKYKI
jgi:hypothetical protein